MHQACSSLRREADLEPACPTTAHASHSESAYTLQEKRQASADAVAGREAAIQQQIADLEAADVKRREVEEMMAQVSLQEPPASFAPFKPPPAPKPPTAGFDADAGGFSL